MQPGIQLVKGDITKIEADAIVNAANTSLLGGGGVDGAIHRAAGPELLEACRRVRIVQGGCKTGDAVLTVAGRLKAKAVIHTVGPVWQGGQKNEAQLLASCYQKALQLAEEKQFQSIAFPNVSTGIFGYPKEAAALIALNTMRQFLDQARYLKTVYVVCYEDDNYQIYARELGAVLN